MWIPCFPDWPKRCTKPADLPVKRSLTRWRRCWLPSRTPCPLVTGRLTTPDLERLSDTALASHQTFWISTPLRTNSSVIWSRWEIWTIKGCKLIHLYILTIGIFGGYNYIIFLELPLLPPPSDLLGDTRRGKTAGASCIRGSGAQCTQCRYGVG